MKSFHRIFAGIIVFMTLFFIIANLLLLHSGNRESSRPYRVEINRIAVEIAEKGFENVDLSGCEYVIGIEKFSSGNSGFYSGNNDYAVREVRGEIYRFDYEAGGRKDTRIIFIVNCMLGVMAALLISVMLFIQEKILNPFDKLSEVPYQLAKGNLTVPLKESKSRFFGRFMWGIELLRENMEQQKQRELELQRERKTLLLSLSHDIKTPLSAIKLYAEALLKGLYSDREKQRKVMEQIKVKADEIEDYISQIICASREDFLSLTVRSGEFYLSELVKAMEEYYGEKLALTKTDFSVGDYADCLLSGDFDRSVEVLQNVMENAVKYGDGRSVSICFSEEEGCIRVLIKNSGCTLPDLELPHIFDSFWRGSNADHARGSGLGLYICRQLMHKMNGEIFAEIRDGFMHITAAFVKA